MLTGLEALHADFSACEGMFNSGLLTFDDVNNLRRFNFLLPDELNKTVADWCLAIKDRALHELHEPVQVSEPTEEADEESKRDAVDNDGFALEGGLAVEVEDLDVGVGDI